MAQVSADHHVVDQAIGADFNATDCGKQFRNRHGEEERGCVEDQPQQATLREDTRKNPGIWFRKVNLCGWSSTQPRSISLKVRAEFEFVSNFELRISNLVMAPPPR